MIRMEVRWKEWNETRRKEEKEGDSQEEKREKRGFYLNEREKGSLKEKQERKQNTNQTSSIHDEMPINKNGIPSLIPHYDMRSSMWTERKTTWKGSH